MRSALASSAASDESNSSSQTHWARDVTSGEEEAWVAGATGRSGVNGYVPFRRTRAMARRCSSKLRVKTWRPSGPATKKRYGVVAG